MQPPYGGGYGPQGAYQQGAPGQPGQPVALSCPNCGGGLGAMQGGQYTCGYCGHRSIPPRPPVDPAQQAASVAASLQQFEARRASVRSRIDEINERERQLAADTRSSNGWVLFGIGVLFLVFALACFAGVVQVALSDGIDSIAPPLLFGLFWLAIGGGMFYGGLRYSRAGRRDKRLRAQGLRGRAILLSYREGSMVLDGNPKFDLVLQVELPGVAPYVVKQSEWVTNPGAVSTGNELPVFVDPRNAGDVMVDWFSAT
jgi:hypothetical protein